MQSLSTMDVCELVGASHRQLDYWHRQGLLTPSVVAARGSGNRRRYSTQDAISAALLRQLSELGCDPLARFSTLIAQIEQRSDELLFVTAGGDVSAQLPDAAVSIVIDVASLRERIEQAVASRC